MGENFEKKERTQGGARLAASGKKTPASKTEGTSEINKEPRNGLVTDGQEKPLKEKKAPVLRSPRPPNPDGKKGGGNSEPLKQDHTDNP